MVVRTGVHRQSLYWLHGDTLISQTSKVKVEGELCEFTLEAIVQVARSLGTKSLDTNRIFSLRDLSVVFNSTDLEPLDNNLQRIMLQFWGVITYKVF